MTPLESFGLDADADERAVKREYARRLKAARPDEDPEAFQALQALYAQALEWVRNPPVFEDFDDDEALASAAESDGDDITFDPAFLARLAMPVRVEPPAEDDYDVEALVARLVDEGRRGGVAAVRTMLADDPELWSLERKTWLGDALLARLEEQTPPMANVVFDAVVAFFSADASVNPYESWRRLRLRNRMHVAFLLQDEQVYRLAEHVRRPMEASIPGSARLKRHLLLNARTPWQRQLLALVPFVPTHLRGFLLRLDEGQLDDLPPPIDPVAVAFWDKVGDLSRISLLRLGVGASRVVAFALLGALVTWAVSDETGDHRLLDGVAAAIGIGGTYAVIASVVALVGWNSERQRRKHGDSGFRWWWVVWLLIVVLNAVRALSS